MNEGSTLDYRQQLFNTSESHIPMDICKLVYYGYVDFTQIDAVNITTILIYVLVMVFAVFGNILVIWTIWRNSHMHTVTNYYIVNLALSDFLVSFLVVPFKLLEYVSPCRWQIFSHDGLCAVLYYILPIFVFVSVFTLVAISLERYYAIVHPLSAMKVNSKSRTKKIIAITWIIPVVICSPYLYCKSQVYAVGSDYGTISRQFCSDRFNELDNDTGTFRRVYFLVLAVFMYFLPTIIIITTCSRIARSLLQPISIEASQSGSRNSKRRNEVNKRKVARMVIVVAVAFILCWSPMYIVSVVSQLQSPSDSFLRQSNFFFTMLTTHLAGFINSCINPFIYTAMSKKFRKSFSLTLGKIFCKYYCRQRLFQYRDSVMQRRSTAYTSASRGSYVEPEAEPLRMPSELKETPLIKGKDTHSSSSDGDSCPSHSRLCKSTNGKHLMAQTNSACTTNNGPEVQCEKSSVPMVRRDLTGSALVIPVGQTKFPSDLLGNRSLTTAGRTPPPPRTLLSLIEPNKNGIKKETFIMDDMKQTVCADDGHVRTVIMCIEDTCDVESVGNDVTPNTYY